jgi:hypothetical protein
VSVGYPLEEQPHVRARDAQSPVRFAPALVLTKREAFEMCEACADAERALLRCGKPTEAARMAAVFEMLEAKLVTDPG